NARDRTIAAAYSVRPTLDARVSAPLRWDEVRRSDPSRFTVPTMPKRLEKVGDLPPGWWRGRGSPPPPLEHPGPPPGHRPIGEPKPNSRARRWTGDGRTRSR